MGKRTNRMTTMVLALCAGTLGLFVGTETRGRSEARGGVEVRLAAPAQAQCNRNCAASERDARGCCPARRRSSMRSRPSETHSAPRANHGWGGTPECEPGLVATEDTMNRCCWPGQAWVPSRSRCVGSPRCRTGFVAQNDGNCGCAEGMVQNADTRGHCCWPGQYWLPSQNACAGDARCPRGFTASGAGCESEAAAGRRGTRSGSRRRLQVDGLDDLPNSALGGTPAAGGTRTVATAMEAAPTMENLPEIPSAAAVRRALGGLMPRIRRCAGDQVGLAAARIRVRNDGSVKAVSIEGPPFGGTPQGSCMERVIRGARFPHFSRRHFDVVYPFSIAAVQARREASEADMVRIRGGTFQMGSNDGVDDERPVHRVTVSTFYLDRTEVTVDAYRACVNAGACRTLPTGEYYNWGVSGRGNHPVNGVSWHGALAYCRWRGARLPTEAEWEYAAGGSAGRTYPWGNSAPTGQLEWSGNGTAPVGSHPGGATPEGVQDLSGNVWEWVSDWHGTYPATDQFNPTGPSSGQHRVIRGGSWETSHASYVRAAERSYLPLDRYYNVGFRCARGELSSLLFPIPSAQIRHQAQLFRKEERRPASQVSASSSMRTMCVSGRRRCEGLATVCGFPSRSRRVRPYEDLVASVQATLAHLAHADTFRLRTAILEDLGLLATGP